MTRKSITTSHAAVACDVCGRTLLRGENAEVFLAGGSRRMVCELCTARATHEGWIREGLDLSAGTSRAREGRGRSLFSRLGRRRDNGHEELPVGGAEDLLPAEPLPAPVDDVAEPAPLAEPVYEPPREPRHVHAIPTNADLKVARAIELFNASEHPRKVSAVARSLGHPIVSVRPSATEGSVVSLVVAWELSWYRYEVDLADEAAGVRAIGQGTHLDELDEQDRAANATADERGELALA
ncbi:MAG: hypothetical protein M3320_06610 [Actinomycetota bacterium]|nr:hypothetical protein [Actinomycetota bacterium]MDQ5808331.1 hypothetical protein [Actinomycetota bacterium]